MKKIFQACFAVAALMLIHGISFAQNSIAAMKLNQPSSTQNLISPSAKPNSEKKPFSDRLNERNIKAIRNFIKSYKDAANVKWLKTVEGSDVVYFSIGDVKNWVFYTRKGIYEGMMRRYNENNLPPDVRHLVKSTYYDFNITHVAEVSSENNIVYIISLSDNRLADKIFYKEIKLANGEMEVMNEYSKKVE